MFRAAKILAAILALALPLSGCATLLDSMTSLDDTTASTLSVLEDVRGALVDPSGATLPSQLALTEQAVARLAGGETDQASLAELVGSLERANEAIGGMITILEGVRRNTESLVWPEGEVPSGEKAGGSVLAGVQRSTSKLAALIPERPTLMLLGGIAIGVLSLLLLGSRRG